jgi:hypothetical protein
VERRAVKVVMRIWNDVGGPGAGIWSIYTLATERLRMFARRVEY